MSFTCLQSLSRLNAGGGGGGGCGKKTPTSTLELRGVKVLDTGGYRFRKKKKIKNLRATAYDPIQAQT